MEPAVAATSNSAWLPVVASLLVACQDVSPSPTSVSPPDDEVVALLQRLSFHLRASPLSASEATALERRLAREPVARVYRDLRREWTDRDFHRRLAEAHLWFDPDVSRLFLGPLEQQAGVLFLPHKAPCARERAEAVFPWWSPGRAVSVCPDSHLPAAAFDGVGYCAGQAEPTVPAPPRPACGCGPLLLGCLPPDSHARGLVQRMNRAVLAEITETGAHILATGQPLAELYRATTTWQPGLVQLLYLRRALLREIHDNRYTLALEARLLAQLRSVDLSDPGRWRARPPPYAGSGLFLTTPAVETAVPTYRVAMKQMLRRALCIDFHSVNVDSRALLHAVGDQHANLRALEVHESPMRSQLGCRDCHAPLDSGAGFLVGLRTPLYGAFPTDGQAVGRLYVRGAHDDRGSGVGFDGLTRLLVAQPEFADCAVRGLVAMFLGVGAASDANGISSRLMAAFAAGGQRLPPLLEALFTSREYTYPVLLGPP